MQVASLQFSVVERDKSATVAKAVDLIRKAKGSDLIILPEIWNIGFMAFENYHSLAETADGLTLTSIRQAARDVKAFVHSGSFVEQREGKYYNSSYLISPEGDILAKYQKIHLYGFNSQETALLTPGQELAVVKTGLATFGLATCYDLRFPEPFRKMVEKGVEVFLVCSAWPYPRLEPWIMLNRVRALENQCFLLSANCCGLNKGSMFTGHSMHTDPWGVILASGGDDETIVRSRVDLELLGDARSRFPALADRVEWLK